MKFVGEGFEVLGSTKVSIKLRVVADPVAMIGISVRCAGAVIVLVDRADPDCTPQ